MCRWQDIGSVYYLTPGSRRNFAVNGVTVDVFNIDGEYYVIKDACPTDGGELFSGELSGDEIVCPRHGERYSIKTGAMQGRSSPKKLDTFLVRISQGQIQIEIEVPEFR